MAVQSVTVNVPGPLYDRLERRAVQTHRTVEEVLLDVLATAVPMADELPPDLAEALSPLTLLNDAALWRAARSHLPTEVAAKLDALHLKRQREGLTDIETQTLAMLVRQYERAMLVQGIATIAKRALRFTERAAHFTHTRRPSSMCRSAS